MEYLVPNSYKGGNNGRQKVHYKKVAASEDFRKLLEEKRRFIVPMTIFFFLFYFSLPVATSYFTFLNTPAIGAISWAWLFALTQFVMTWVLCGLYAKKQLSSTIM